MGTNIYARPVKQIKAIETKKQESIAEAKANNLIGLVPIIEEWAEQLISKLKPIHIGKRSAGWRFLFNHNNWQYYNNVAEMKEWLKDYQLFSQYREDLSFDEFWDDVEQRQQTQKQHSGSYDPRWYIIKDGYEFSTSVEFYISIN